MLALAAHFITVVSRTFSLTMKFAFLLIGAAAAANVAHVRTAPAALKSMTPTKYGTCKHVGCVSHAGNVHVFHTTNNADGAHGPGTPDPKCKNQASPSASCKFGWVVQHQCAYNKAADKCACTCWQVTPSPTPRHGRLRQRPLRQRARCREQPELRRVQQVPVRR